MPEVLFGLVGVIIGAAIATYTAHRVASQTAKREWYARYLADIDEYARGLAHRVLSAERFASPELLRSMPANDVAIRANAALVAIMVLGPPATVTLADRLQTLVVTMSTEAAMVPPGGFPSDHPWHALLREFTTLRGRLVQLARKETGAKELPRDLLS